MTRTDARELLMQMLYSMEIQKDFSKDAMNTFLKDKPMGNQKKYISQMYHIIIDKKEEIDNLYSENATGWKINRLSNVDLSIFRIAIAEIMFTPDIPNGVSINEAVEMAKKFSSEESAKFINGVLAKIAE